MLVENAYELLRTLKEAGYLQTDRDLLWWPNSGSESVIIGTILTQQTKWERVEEALANLKREGIDTLQAIATADSAQLQEAIRPAGFYKTKAARLQQLSRDITDRFGNFETFQTNVDRAWLLARKGIGEESADAILCYACMRPVMVIDSYTMRLLDALGYRFETYAQAQEWLCEGIETHFDKIEALYDEPVDLHAVYARFHGKIVEFAKTYIRGRKVDLSLFTR